jgi:hypothetical protein
MHFYNRRINVFSFVGAERPGFGRNGKKIQFLKGKKLLLLAQSLVSKGQCFGCRPLLGFPWGYQSCGTGKTGFELPLLICGADKEI